jgi:hypothetical protein
MDLPMTEWGANNAPLSFIPEEAYNKDMITPLADGQDPPRYPLDPISIDVTMQEHLELLKSPRKCLALGIDITYERMVYEERRQWNGFPPLPDIDPNEEIDP